MVFETLDHQNIEKIYTDFQTGRFQAISNQTQFSVFYFNKIYKEDPLIKQNFF